MLSTTGMPIKSLLGEPCTASRKTCKTNAAGRIIAGPPWRALLRARADRYADRVFGALPAFRWGSRSRISPDVDRGATRVRKSCGHYVTLDPRLRHGAVWRLEPGRAEVR